MAAFHCASSLRAFAAEGIVLLLCALLTGGSAFAGPKLELRPENLDFGAIKQGEKLRKTIQVRNGGDADLVISLVRASCTECVVDKISGKTLKPGEEMELPVTYDAAAAPGKHPANLTFHTNDPDDNGLKRLQIAVEIVAKAAPTLEFEPASLDVGIFSREKGIECAVQLKNSGDAPLKFEEFSASPGIAIKARPEGLAAGKQEALKFTIAPKEAGILQSHVTIATNDPRNPIATIPIRGYAASREQLDRLLKGVLIVPEGAAPEGATFQSLRIFNYSAFPITVRPEGKLGAVAVNPGKSVEMPGSGEALQQIVIAVFGKGAEPAPKEKER